MSPKKKIVVLGTADCLKKSLISVILGKDISVHRNTQMKTETYENDTYEVIYTPNLYNASEEMKKKNSSQQTDMCLLVVEDGISPEEVQQQIKNLHKITGKPKEEFIVVLPLSCKNRDDYPANCSLGELFSKLAEDTQMMQPNKRSADQTPTKMETDEPQSDFMEGNHSDNKLNLVLLGMCGTGKSASGNTILGKKQFVSRASSMLITTEWQAAETVIDGTRVRVIDTPDIFDDDIKSSVKNQHVTKCKQLLQPGPYVFLLVIQIGRLANNERDILKKLEEAFGIRAKEQTVILFTRGEELQRAKMSLEDFLQDCDSDLKNIVDQCGRRCVVFDNNSPCQHQVEELMQTVIRIKLNKYQNQ